MNKLKTLTCSFLMALFLIAVALCIICGVKWLLDYSPLAFGVIGIFIIFLGLWYSIYEGMR